MTFRRIMLVAAWLAGLYFLYWSLVFDPAQPPVSILAAGCGLLVLSLLETRFHVKGGGSFFTFLMPIALLGMATVVLLAAPAVDTAGDEDASSITLYGQTNDISDQIHVAASRIPATPFFQKDEVCALNLQELHLLVMNEWNARQPNSSPSPTCITLDKVGTDRFRVVGSWMTDHTLQLKPSEGVLAMYFAVDSPNPIRPVGMVLHFFDRRQAARMNSGDWYEVTGRLVVNPETGTYPFQEMTSSQQMMTAWLKVEEVRPVEHPVQDTIIKNTTVPPYNPVIVKYLEDE